MYVSRSNSVNHDWVWALSNGNYSLLFIYNWDWTSNSQGIALKSTFQPNTDIRCAMRPAGQFRVNIWIYKRNISISPCNTPHYNYTFAHIAMFFHPALLIISSHIVFISIIFNRSLCAISLRRLILQCSFLSIILTSSHKSLHFLAIPDFLTSSHHSVFPCPSNLILVEACLAFCMGRIKFNSWSCCIQLESWLG